MLGFNLIAMVIFLSGSWGKEIELDINKYLFDSHNFQFIDLTLSVVKTKSPQQLNQFDFEDRSENEWIQTNIHIESIPESYSSTGIRSIQYIPMEKLILPLMIADISSKVGNNPNFVLQKHHLDYMLNNYFGKTEQPCLLVFKFGWSSLTNNSTVSPGISIEVASWITKAYKNIVGVGVDLPSVDPGSSTGHATHNALVKAGVYVVVNVNLGQYLPEAWCTAVLLPQSTHETKGPARFVTICPNERMVKHDIPWHRL